MSTDPHAHAVRLVEITRRDITTGEEIVESVHHGHLVAISVPPEGNPGAAGRAEGEQQTLAALGDPHALIFPRSAVKPLQAAACLELLDRAAAERPGDAFRPLTSAELAVAWASHRAEPAQLDAVGALLSRIGSDPEEVLTCPRAGVPDDPSATRSHLAHNCSGKHALFALTAHRLGLPMDRSARLDADGPLQRLILARVAETLGEPVAIGVDGCGAPAVAVPLDALARAFAHLAIEERFERVRAAGLAHPRLVGGSTPAQGGRRLPLVDTALLEAGVIAKRGAEGVLAAGWRRPDGSGGGIAVKASDGSMRGAASALIGALARLDVIDTAVWHEAAPTGGGEPAGVVRVTSER
jgi:L-asparaginase II